MDGYTYDEWLAMERLRSLGEYRGRKLDLGRKAAEERRRLIETRWSYSLGRQVEEEVL